VVAYSPVRRRHRPSTLPSRSSPAFRVRPRTPRQPPLPPVGAFGFDLWQIPVAHVAVVLLSTRVRSLNDRCRGWDRLIGRSWSATCLVSLAMSTTLAPFRGSVLHQFGAFQAQSCTLWGVALCAIAKCRRITASLTPTQRVTVGCLSAGRGARGYAASVSHVSMTDPQAAFSQAGRSCPPGQPERAALFSRAMSYGQDGDCPARLIDTSKRGHRSHLARARRDHSPPIQIAPYGAFGSEATEISRTFPPLCFCRAGGRGSKLAGVVTRSTSSTT
jgi:hypothetical protein